HARSPHCSTPIAGFLKLSEPIDFDAIDGDPVDLVFVLLVPEEADDTHLSLLGQVATIMNDADTRQQLRKAGSQRELLDLITAKIREHSVS
ncbi:MAG TPA: PTS sugar transporter subunit IIA, partial [Halomonas sp.]|nr:PTS sugar transporter subunit IIA [Halomonas sp.]